MKKLLVRIIFSVYDLLNKKFITRNYKIAKHNNLHGINFSEEDLSNHLSKWGFNPDILLNPIMTKRDLMKWINKVDEKVVHQWAYTGGSFGEPLRVPYSKKRSFLRTSTFKFFNELGGYNLGDSFALIRAKNKSHFIKYLRNELIIIPQDVSPEKLKEIVTEIINNKVEVLMGYPTVMYELALFIGDNPQLKKKLRIKSLISVSEMLDDKRRQFVKEVFDCNFVDRYSNEEVGLIAQQKEFGGAYFTNKFGVYVEVVNPKTLQPVEEGETGKVLVTDIYNDLIPIVRYDTGDLAIVEKYKGNQVYTLKKIIGREAEKIFDVAGKPVSSLILGPSIYKPMAATNFLSQFQFAQITKNAYELRIKKTNTHTLGKDSENHILENLKAILGEKAVINICYVENILPQPSGKRPVYKNEINNA